MSGTGVPQGLKTSPELYSIYQDELAEELISRGIPVFQYADDIASLGYGCAFTRRFSTIIEKWAQKC